MKGVRGRRVGMLSEGKFKKKTTFSSENLGSMELIAMQSGAWSLLKSFESLVKSTEITNCQV